MKKRNRFVYANVAKINEITKLLDFSGYIELLLWFDSSNKLLAIKIFINSILIYI